MVTATRTYYLFAASADDVLKWKDKIIKNGGLWDDNPRY